MCVCLSDIKLAIEFQGQGQISICVLSKALCDPLGQLCPCDDQCQFYEN